MDEQSKEQFKWKFYRLAIQLNAIILLVALAILFVFLAPQPYRLPAVVIMLVVAAVLSWNFIGKYRATKAWLHEH
ncbi:hypothetical protein [Methanoregula sp. UBA64]|jgi:hypothetical protein|uniref:hypothetical protein n=1 Tax=Methanoregula sp. UBA64 TaxID=1915554 RepID=UPI0025DF11D2|nr:hypothetical protein [Methanoregula sp. UBA64]